VSLKKADDDYINAELNKLRARPKNTGGFAQAIIDSGFSLTSQPRVEIASTRLFNASTLPGSETWRVTGPSIAPLGQDWRFLYSNLPTQNVTGVSAVQDFTQTAHAHRDRRPRPRRYDRQGEARCHAGGCH
jgi:hypothetical protein